MVCPMAVQGNAVAWGGVMLYDRRHLVIVAPENGPERSNAGSNQDRPHFGPAGIELNPVNFSGNRMEIASALTMPRLEDQ